MPITRAELARKVARLLAMPAVVPQRLADALTCPACGNQTAGEVIGILVGNIDSDWRVCGACHHLWSANESTGLFPLLLGSPTHLANAERDRRVPPQG